MGKVFIIAEAGVNHNGDPDLAFKLIDVAAESGADAVKFQTFKASECASKGCASAEYQRSGDDSETQYSLLKRLELPFLVFKRLSEYARSKNISFISTPDGKASLECLVKLDAERIKIGSGEVNNLPFLRIIGATGLRAILSTGMSTLDEVETAIEVLRKAGCREVSLLHCTSAYPARADEMNLLAMVTLKEAFQIPTGLSDHSKGSEAAIAAVALGAEIIEKHITLDRGMPGPDHKASMAPSLFRQFVRSVRKASLMLGSPVKSPTKSELELLKLVRRSLVSTRRIRKGEALTTQNTDFKRPGTGIPPTMAEKALSGRASREIPADSLIQWSDIEL